MFLSVHVCSISDATRTHVIAIHCGAQLCSLLPLRIHGNKRLAGNTHWLGKYHTKRQAHTHTQAKSQEGHG